MSAGGPPGRCRIGITLPQFRDDPGPAIDLAREAEALGLDGVFCFDHLWPMGQPGRPALAMFPLMGALLAETSSIAVGSLVARIGLLADAQLVDGMRSLEALAPGRVIAGLGTGDSKSRAENEAFGIPFEPAGRRRDRLDAVAAEIASGGIPVWMAGAGERSVALAARIGGAVNLWDAPDEDVEQVAAAGVEVTWGGPIDGDDAAVADRITRLAGAGASWVVVASPRSLEPVAG